VVSLPGWLCALSLRCVTTDLNVRVGRENACLVVDELDEYQGADFHHCLARILSTALVDPKVPLSSSSLASPKLPTPLSIPRIYADDLDTR